MHWLVGHAPESVKYKFTKFGRLSVTDHREGAKITLKSFFLSSRRVLIKNKRALSRAQKIGENGLYLILGAVTGRARPKIC